jgi:citronellol/citronellal dehydrogenase
MLNFQAAVFTVIFVELRIRCRDCPLFLWTHHILAYFVVLKLHIFIQLSHHPFLLSMKSFENKTVLITGGTRGIGKAIAIRLAGEGANIAIVGKTAEANPKLEGTIYTAAEEIRAAAAGAAGGGGQVLPLQGDIRFEDQIRDVVAKTIGKFGQLDILVNNASAINIATTELTEVKRFDLIQSINVRGTFLMSQACIPHLKNAHNPHILNLSPPLNLDPRWFAPHLAYTLSKYGMSMIVLGLAEELRQYRIAANGLWPRTTIATAAVMNLLGGDFLVQRSRTPEIVADAAFVILQKPSFETTGNFFIDEDVLKAEGVSDFSKYAVNPDHKLMNDLFL